MKYICGSIISCICLSQILIAQPNALWARTYGGEGDDNGYSVQQTSDGGFVVAGYTQSFGAGGRDAFLIRTDAYGDTLWTRTYGDSSYEVARSVQQTADDGFIVAGNGWGIFGNGDSWLLRVDAQGDTLWTRRYEGDRVVSVQQTSDSGFMVAVFKDDYLWFIRTDAQGDTLWTRTSVAIWPTDMQQTSDGGFIVTGSTSFVPLTPPGGCLLRTDSLGGTIWKRGYEEWVVQSIQQTPNDGFIVAGSVCCLEGFTAVLLFRTDVQGDTLWTRRYGGGGGGDNFGSSVQQTSDGGFVVAGNTPSFGAGGFDIWLIKTDSTGDTLWTRIYGGDSSDVGHSVKLTSDGGFMVAGETSSFGAGGSDVWLIKTDSLGNTAPLGVTDRGYKELPQVFTLHQNYPNPFNPVSTIQYELPQGSEVSLIVYDILGREVARLVNGYMEPGYHQVTWNGCDQNGCSVPSGIYITRLITTEYAKAIKMVLLK
jgi:predicted secreted protein